MHKHYSSYGVSGVNMHKDVLQGRPYGGVAVLWNTNMFSPFIQVSRPMAVITPNNHSKRVCAVETVLPNNSKVLMCSIYMPTDNRNMLYTNDEFEMVLDDLSCCIEQSNPEYIILGGVWNSNNYVK